MRIFRALVTLLSFAGLVSNASAAPRSVTLEQARAAISRAPAHKTAASEISAAAESTDAAGAWPATTVGISSSRRTARFGLVASFPIPVFGTLGANRAVARAELDLARARARSVDGDLERDVTVAWLALARAEAIAALSEQAAARQDTLLRIARTRFEAGDVPQVDVTTAQANAARAQADANADRAAIASASADLAALLGWDPIAPLSAAGGIPDPGDVPSLAELRRRRSGHPDVRVASAERDVREADVREARAGHRPALSLDLESMFDDPTLPGNDYRVGLTLELPLLGKGSAATKSAVARQRTAELAREETVSAIDAAIVAAYHRYAAAVERLRVLSEEVLPAQRLAAELAREAYTEGQSGLVTVVEAERALADAEAQGIEARADAATARAELAWATGGAW